MKKTIIWDWNGTIVDDVGIALDAVNDMLRERGSAPITMEEYRMAMDTPILRFYEHFFDMETVSFDWIAERFNGYYDGHQQELSLHPGVRSAIRGSAGRGCHQIVLSSSATSIIQQYAEQFALTSYFEAILGAEDLLAASKLDRAVAYFQKQQLDPEEAVLIGDTVHDYEVAEALGVDCILLTCGHQDRESLLACGCPVYDAINDQQLWCACT